MPRLIIHGGAWNIPDAYDEDHVNGIRKALEFVYPLLVEGMSALDAVERAVNILEEDPTFDAGKGAFLNIAGGIELDGIIVDGRTINFGAVAGVKNILHPVSLARMVMDRTEHCFLVGDGANLFAKSQGMEVLTTEELLTDREMEYYLQIKNDPSFKTHHPFESPSDTVGAVAMDTEGNIAAATSTGGTPRKLVGRVGDSPILGAGAYADNDIGGISATGWGETIMRSLLSKYVIDQLRVKGSDDCVAESLDYIKRKFNGMAGLIGVDKSGKYLYGYNTPKMAFGMVDNGKYIISIKS